MKICTSATSILKLSSAGKKEDCSVIAEKEAFPIFATAVSSIDLSKLLTRR